MAKLTMKNFKPMKLKIHKKLFKLDPKDFFQNQDNVALALSEALLEGDKDAFQEIIKSYLGVINKEELARISKVPIATIRRVAAGTNYNIETLLKITAAINKAA
jgi:hypothetical protein